MKKAGFTLIELSVVLVVVALVIGGIMGGQALLRQAKLRGYMVDVATYRTAIKTFQDKYASQPGDMVDATTTWGLLAGAATANDATCNAAKATAKPTCNGDGDGWISASTERFRAWQHLSNADMIPGRFTGLTGTSPVYVTGTNVPGGKIEGTYFVIEALTATSSGGAATTNMFDSLPAGHFLTFTAPTKMPFAPAEALSIDTKLDDGQPGMGSIIGNPSSGTASAYTGCSTTDVYSTAEYNISNTDNKCFLKARFD